MPGSDNFILRSADCYILLLLVFIGANIGSTGTITMKGANTYVYQQWFHKCRFSQTLFSEVPVHTNIG